jgi:hypothetical protein
MSRLPKFFEPGSVGDPDPQPDPDPQDPHVFGHPFSHECVECREIMLAKYNFNTNF